MKIGRRATLAELDAKGWTAFAAEAGLGLPLVRRRVTDMCERVGAQIPAIVAALSQPGLDDGAVARFGAMIGERLVLCARSVK